MNTEIHVKRTFLVLVVLSMLGSQILQYDRLSLNATFIVACLIIAGMAFIPTLTSYQNTDGTKPTKQQVFAQHFAPLMQLKKVALHCACILTAGTILVELIDARLIRPASINNIHAATVVTAVMAIYICLAAAPSIMGAQLTPYKITKLVYGQWSIYTHNEEDDLVFYLRGNILVNVSRQGSATGILIAKVDRSFATSKYVDFTQVENKVARVDWDGKRAYFT